jgi:hypothetical protein
MMRRDAAPALGRIGVSRTNKMPARAFWTQRAQWLRLAAGFLAWDSGAFFAGLG